MLPCSSHSDSGLEICSHQHPFLKVEVTVVRMQSSYIWRVTWGVITETWWWGGRGDLALSRPVKTVNKELMRKLQFLPFLNPLQKNWVSTYKSTTICRLIVMETSPCCRFLQLAILCNWSVDHIVWMHTVSHLFY